MKLFACTCGNTLFFENTLCVSCGREVGWCPVCASLCTLLPDGDALRCAGETCGARLVKCHNYAVERVCNRCCPAGGPPAPLCDCCRFNDTIPDLAVPGNREKWGRLETAKRRLLYTLDRLGLPYGRREDGVEPPLSFDFLADIVTSGESGWTPGDADRVYTGHAGGKITINLREADAVEREKARVRFGEAHRTLIGHFRHEIAHYYWQMLVTGRRDAAFAAVFGDPGADYAAARQRYYDQGPAAGWQNAYVSAYATLHPWEDFAETFATYLDVVALLDTDVHVGSGDVDPVRAELSTMIDRYVALGVVLNEMNRTMGLVDLVPVVFAPPIVEKLGFVHRLVREAGQPARGGAGH